MRRQPESQGAKFRCAYCGEINHTFVDLSQGTTQRYVEDCQLCRRPNELMISYNEWTEEFIIQAKNSD